MATRVKRGRAKRKKPETPDRYFEAAVQRRAEADFLRRGNGYEPGAIYLIGIAAECLLRAFIYKNNPHATIPKKQQHNLKILANRYFLKLIKNPDVFIEVEKANTYLYETWEIRHRYRNSARLKSFFKKKRTKFGTTNLKTITERALIAFDVLFKVAIARWRRTNKK